MPSTSGTSKSGGPIDLLTPPLMDDSVDDESVVDDDDDLCCVCNKFQPEELSNCHVVTFVKWTNCAFCDHWTHLIYCSNVRVITFRFKLINVVYKDPFVKFYIGTVFQCISFSDAYF